MKQKQVVAKTKKTKNKKQKKQKKHENDGVYTMKQKQSVAPT